MTDIHEIHLFNIIKAHFSYVTSLLLLSDGRLASCSYDSTIKIFNINNGYYY